MLAISSYIDDIRTSSKNIKLFLISYLFFGVQAGSYWTTYTVIVQETFGTKSLGFILGLNNLVLALFAIPIGAITNKFGLKKMMFVSGLLNTILMALIPFSPNMMILVILTIIQGPFSSAWDVLPAPLINACSKEKGRTTIFSVMYAGYWVIVGIVSNLSGNFITYFQTQLNISQLEAYKYFCLITCAFSLISIIPLFFMDSIKIKTSSNNNKSENSFSLKYIFKNFIDVANKDVVLFLTYTSLIGLGSGLFTPFFANFFKTGLNLNPITVGNIMSFQYFALVIGLLICPFVEKKLGRIGTLGITSLLSVPFMLLIPNCDSLGSNMLPVLSFAFFMRSGLMNINMPLANTEIIEFVDEEKSSTVSGIQSTCKIGFISLSNFLAGYIMSIPAFKFLGLTIDGYRIPYYIAAVLYLSSQILLFKVFYKKYNRPKINE